MSSVAVVYHSVKGHTEKQAQAVWNGAKAVSGTNAKLINVMDMEKCWDELDAADAIIFGCPTYMGSATADFKRFMDDTSKRWLTQAWRDKVAAGFTNSGSLSGDKLGTIIQMAIFAAQHSMIWVGLDIMPGTNHNSKILNRIGGFMGAMAQSDNVPVEQSPGEDDLATAERLGERVAIITSKIRRI